MTEFLEYPDIMQEVRGSMVSLFLLLSPIGSYFRSSDPCFKLPNHCLLDSLRPSIEYSLIISL